MDKKQKRLAANIIIIAFILVGICWIVSLFVRKYSTRCGARTGLYKRHSLRGVSEGAAGRYACRNRG